MYCRLEKCSAELRVLDTASMTWELPATKVEEQKKGGDKKDAVDYNALGR
jgi:hypothetical protein